MGTRKVYFTLGEQAGQLLTNIAREHLLYSLNPTKAIDLIKGSLIGCSTQIALDILIGKLVLMTDKDKVSINAIKYTPDMKDKYPMLDFEEWAGDKILQMRQTAKGWDMAINELKRAIIKSDGEFRIDVRYDQLIRFFYSGDSENLIDLEHDTIGSVKCTIVGIRNFIEECFKIISVIKWLEKQYPGEIPDGFTLLPVEVRGLNLRLTDLMTRDNDVEKFLSQNNYRNALVDSFIQNERSIQKTIQNGIKPVDITIGYNAGWLAPNGDFYGLNGDIANMLHIQIANALLGAGIIPQNEKSMNNPDGWLSKNGWIKIHGNHILYDGYMQSNYGMPLIPITEIQRESIIRYGQICHRGMLRFGLTFQPCSAAKFGMIDEFMIRKLFDFEV